MIAIMNRACAFAGICQRRLRHLADDQRGISAVEFALLVPLMISVYLGVVELSQGISAQRKVTLTTRTIADLIAQASSITNNDMTNSFTAATAVMAPFPDTNLKLKVTSVAIDGNGKATVAWSDAKNTSGYSKGSAVTLPDALNIPNTSLIWSEVEYAFTPTIGYVISGTLSLKDRIYMRPRLSESVTRTTS